MDLWIFDNDGTLYDDRQVGQQFSIKFAEYTAHLLAIPTNQVATLVVELKQKWSTDFSVLALAWEYGLDIEQVVNNTYMQLSLNDCGLMPDDQKAQTLKAIVAKKVILTNNPSRFAHRVLSHLDLTGFFSDVVGMVEVGCKLKPNIQAYQTILDRHPGYERFIFCDDSLINLDAAKKIGWLTIWCKPAHIMETVCDHLVVNSFQELAKLEL